MGSSASSSSPAGPAGTTPRRSAQAIPVSIGAMLVTIGVVYGDIGTSPMYVTKALLAGNGGLASVDQEFVLGSISLVIWTITLLTTLKYVLIALRADNRGEGGIFALYSLIRNCGRWLLLPAVLGGAALLADGVLTPAVTITTAVEGLRTIPAVSSAIGTDQANVVVIALVIISALFLLQRVGTAKIGRAFGPVMSLWFAFLGISGAIALAHNPVVLLALDPLRGIRFLLSPHNAAGPMILGSCFLATTGAEALYSDMGHVGRGNIYATWPIVKACLLINYMGQGAWLLSHADDARLLSVTDLNPFYEMLPEQLRPFAVGLSAAAAIIASQALVTGAFSLVSEASRLELMPKMQVFYPAETRGQAYIPLVNNVMWVGCVFVVLLFQSSARMEAAYGLAITITMLSTTSLLFVYLRRVRDLKVSPWPFLAFFVTLEAVFLVASLAKFLHGGYVTVLMTMLIMGVMVCWKRGGDVERRQAVMLPVRRYVSQFRELRHDHAYEMVADNVVYLTNSTSDDRLDRDILYSILDNHPKRARAWWFVSVEVSDEPYAYSYQVSRYGTDCLFRVHLHLGYKVDQRVNAYLRQVVGDLYGAGQLPEQRHSYSIYDDSGPIGSFRFYLVRKTLSPESDVSAQERTAITMRDAIRRWAGSPERWYGLENSTVEYESVPIFTAFKPVRRMERIPDPEPEPDDARSTLR